jgi:SAM-dependent methyltransferase
MAGTRWDGSGGAGRGDDYAARFTTLAAAGVDIHGEASFCAKLVRPGARVLDAGCGTGRVAIRLAELGYRCTGVDVDTSMLAVARQASSDVTWLPRDLADLGELGPPFDLIVAAGNVIPLLADGTEAAVIRALADRLAPAGRFVAGFGLDAAHLPLAGPPFGLEQYDAWCTAAGLVVDARYATWAADPFDNNGYAVTVSRLSTP